MTHTKLTSILAAALFAVASVGCGGEEGTETKPSGTPEDSNAGTPAPAAAPAKITTVEAARKALQGKWSINQAETKKLLQIESEHFLLVPHITFTEKGSIDWAGSFKADDKGMGDTVTKFDLKAGDGENKFVISAIHGVWPNGNDWTDDKANIGVTFGTMDQMTLTVGEKYALMSSQDHRTLVFDRMK